MNKTKRVIFGGLIAASLLAAGKPALAWNDGWRSDEIRRDYADLEQMRRRLYRDELELRRALRNGAAPAEVAYDRRQVARDRRILAYAGAELARDRGGYGWRDSGW